MDHDDEQPEGTATEEGLHDQAEELAGDEQNSGETPDPRDPGDWREMPKEGGGA